MRFSGHGLGTDWPGHALACVSFGLCMGWAGHDLSCAWLGKGWA
jgi:hypothetical protein